MRFLSCTHCGMRVFFENTFCEGCGSALGFVPAEQAMVAFSVAQDGSWQRLGHAGAAQKPCINYTLHQVCNWMVPSDEHESLCTSCLTTTTIPALSKFENRVSWAALEKAKRRLFYTLLTLGLPSPPKSQDPENGLCFKFLEDLHPHKRVLTGHDNGVITLNIAEADDAKREKIRQDMHEPYRTLVGHFRHESGHYYWDRLIRDTGWLDEYRRVFGDERLDYAAALKAHYQHNAVPDPGSYISAYASAHPWEDWAECWAHYLHMVDGLETAQAWGLRLDCATPIPLPVQPQAVSLETESIQSMLIQHWLPVSQFVNAMNRSLGSSDSYPFVVTGQVIQKLDFVHRVVRAAVRGDMPMTFAPSAEPADACR